MTTLKSLKQVLAHQLMSPNIWMSDVTDMLCYIILIFNRYIHWFAFFSGINK